MKLSCDILITVRLLTQKEALNALGKRLVVIHRRSERRREENVSCPG
jgi:hypothetical protein